jgi:DNA-binding NarL/FixJ family response regulator
VNRGSAGQGFSGPGDPYFPHLSVRGVPDVQPGVPGVASTSLAGAERRAGLQKGTTGVIRPRIVLADDHPGMATELHALLATDYDVVEIVGDGGALIETVTRVRPDAIVCDIAMPGMSGLTAASSILATLPDARIVFVTVLDSRAVIRRALDSGARGYVLKCDAGHELVGAVHTALHGGYYVSTNARMAAGSRAPSQSDDDEPMVLEPSE